MTKKLRVIVTGALVGFLVALGLAIFAFTPTGESGDYVTLFLVLCPPSMAAMHDQSLIFSILTWIIVCILNGGLYAAGAAILRVAIRRTFD